MKYIGHSDNGKKELHSRIKQMQIGFPDATCANMYLVLSTEYGRFPTQTSINPVLCADKFDTHCRIQLSIVFSTDAMQA